MIDILHDINGDLLTANGDLVIGVSDQQHQQDLILSEKGSIKQFPDAGVGAASFLESEDVAGLLREIGLQFTADGMDVKELSMKADGTLYINAPYK